MANTFRGLLPDGRLPSEAVAHVQEIAGDGGGGVDIKVGGVQPVEGWWLDTSGSFIPPAPDTTPPVVGTLSVAPSGGRTAVLTVSGASDDQPGMVFGFSSDNGATWTGYQSGAEHTFTDLTPAAGYAFRHRVRDSGGNVVVGVAVPVTMPAMESAFRDAVLAHAPAHYWPLDDPAGTLLANLRNLGTATEYRKLDAVGVLGAPTLGDGNTAVQRPEAGAAAVVSRLSTEFRSGPWTILFLCGLEAGVSGKQLLRGAIDATLHDSGRLLFSSSVISGTTAIHEEITSEQWPGRHLVTISWDGTSTAQIYWDGTHIATYTGTNNIGTSGVATHVGDSAPGIYSSVAHFHTALTHAEVSALYAALGAE